MNNIHSAGKMGNGHVVGKPEVDEVNSVGRLESRVGRVNVKTAGVYVGKKAVVAVTKKGGIRVGN